MFDTTSNTHIRAEIQRAAAVYSKYARVDGPVPPGQYHCPLTYGIPAMGNVIGQLNDRVNWYEPPLRRKVLAVIKKLEREVNNIAGYAAWLQEMIDFWSAPASYDRWGTAGAPERYGRTLGVAKTFISDLEDSIKVLQEVAKQCPTRR